MEKKDNFGISESAFKVVRHKELSAAQSGMSVPLPNTGSRKILVPSPSSDPRDPLVSSN